MVTLQQQARALGDPTRHGVFRYVADAGHPVGVAELTDRFGLNHNAIRQHLAKLVDAGLVVEAKAPSVGRGRPRLLYALDPGAESRWGVMGPYEQLSLWLAEIVRSGDSPIEVGRRAGRRTAAGAAEADTSRTTDPVERFVGHMAHHGFEPKVSRRGPKIELTLQTCPFETTAVADPGTVCDLHLGIAQGIADGIDGLVVDELVPNHPHRAQCRLRCHLTT